MAIINVSITTKDVCIYLKTKNFLALRASPFASDGENCAGGPAGANLARRQCWQQCALYKNARRTRHRDWGTLRAVLALFDVRTADRAPGMTG